jgi:hypothetical protein
MGLKLGSMTDGMREKFAVIQRSMERSMMFVRRLDKISYKKIRKSTQVKDFVTAAKELKWAGHIARYPEERLPNTIENWTPGDAK